ncbi:MAG: selenocysteine-specific translation elongation factor [Deltaproteobacteria bacterium]|nr:selenocysteine-specific translation elongation factor [Deltaproteobacteria bacterium]
MPFIIGTAGHIDHGKTSLIKALTGMDTDRLKEEKERGISIDLGFAYLDLPDGAKAGIVDVPGHERFIKNMLAGATGIDLVLFVIAADDGIMPQTREHLDIMRLLGISNGIFVITKMDLADESRISKVTAAVKELIKDTCLKDSPIIPVSAATGFGIDNLKKLISTEAQKVLSKPEGGFFRLPIDRSFSIKGFGTVVTGAVASGRIRKNDEVVLISKRQNIQKKVKIRGIQSHFNALDTVGVGQRAAINLSGISPADIERGDLLASPDLDAVSSRVDVCLEFLPAGTDFKSVPRPVKNHSVLKLHHMTGETLVQVLFADVQEAGPGIKVFGQMRLKEPMAMLRGDRFILRNPSINATIGGGRVLLPYAKKRKSADVEQYRILNSQDMKMVVISLLSNKDIVGIDMHEMRLMLNLSDKGLKDLITSEMETIVLIGEQLLLRERVKEIEERIIEFIKKYHIERPGDVGVDEDYIIKEVISHGMGGTDLEKIELRIKSVPGTILDSLVNSGRIAKTGNVFCLPSHKPEAKGKEKEIENGILSMFSTQGFNPIKMDEILCRPSHREEDIKKVFQLLIKRGIVVKVTEDSCISKKKLDEAKDKLTGWIADKGKIKAAEFRDILGCGRKFAIELLEHFDKEKVTLRSGDYRILRKTEK